MSRADHNPTACPCGCGLQTVRIRALGKNRGRFGWVKSTDSVVEFAGSFATADEALSAGHKRYGKVQ